MMHIKLSSKKNSTAKAVVKLASTLKKKQARTRRQEQVRLLTGCL